MTASLHPDTVAVHGGRSDLEGLGVHALPIDLSTTNPLPDIERGGDSYEAMATGGRPPADGSMVYARLWNPTVARFEEALAELEHAEAAVAFASGMAAMTAVILAHTGATGARHVVAVRPLYGGTDHLLGSGLLGVETTYCHPDEVAAAVRPDTGLVVVETPANPTLDIADIADVVRQAGTVPVVVDNTFATPVLQNPIDLGAAMSLHSATKYLGGHSDVVGGFVATSRTDLAEHLSFTQNAVGAVPGPFDCYLAMRGVKTLAVRMDRHCRNARAVVEALSAHPAVRTVYYPGLADHPGHDVAARQMDDFGGMVSFTCQGGPEAARRVAAATRVFTLAESLGAVESLIEHPGAMTHAAAVGSALEVPDDLLRLSVGIESADDLVADLTAALDAASDAPVAPSAG
ncbi:aminotransferase class I/II-fold pyridoxal phosphate-dependent enzyme [Microbacterium maritypicum]|uniref:trans-sulfuration enzyme family protein n=1 Tax=Microbacterium maritypicum TaxID=33918 RepID=UPI00296E32CA|nr:aminotransferase class I/II-fold pyridoxal phosphate-dependent enzyme [Microbacterium liquefaciens]